MKANNISIKKTSNSRLSGIDFDHVEFGKVFSDHMLLADYYDGKWQDFRITPFENITVSPAFFTLHYGQSIFEGMKAHKSADGEVVLFRPMDNFNRLNVSAERMCIPQIDSQTLLDGLQELLKLDEDWIPNTPDGALYLRPFIFATDEYIGVRPSLKYRFVLFTCPVNKYYEQPVKVKIETKYARASEGGVGFAKAAGNYAASLYPTQLANNEGFDQIIWTDSKEHKYIEESGTMNLMVIINDTIITPPTGETILKGITRDSVLQIAHDLGYKTEERKLSVEEVISAHRNGSLTDMFGTGTAVTITHVSAFGLEDEIFELPPVEERSISIQLKKELEAIKRGAKTTNHDWIVKA
ncbi:MAG: branched-chain amino acid aminotransferase [Glaciecola sp.]|jgi:branched-chain amino acid aminotransferase